MTSRIIFSATGSFRVGDHTGELSSLVFVAYPELFSEIRASDAGMTLHRKTSRPITGPVTFPRRFISLPRPLPSGASLNKYRRRQSCAFPGSPRSDLNKRITEGEADGQRTSSKSASSSRSQVERSRHSDQKDERGAGVRAHSSPP